MLAKDVMTAAVVAAAPDTKVGEIARAMLENGISAVPVVDANRRVLGMVSEGDLMRRPESDTEAAPSWWLRVFGSADDLAEHYTRSHGQRAEDVMTRPAVTVPEDMPLGEVAALLEKRRIKRVPVVRDGALVGIVSRANLIRGLATAATAAPAAPSADDRAIRERVAETIEREFGTRAWLVDYTVSGGTVALWGSAESEAEKNAIRVAVENVPGVAAVDDHLGVMPATLRSLIWAE